MRETTDAAVCPGPLAWPGAPLASGPQSLDAERLDALASSVGQGDRAAFHEIYETLVGEIFRYVRGQTQDDHDAEDIVSDVFLRAWRSAPRYRAGSNAYRQWLFTIARNRVRSHWAAHVPVSELTPDLADESEELDREDPVELRRVILLALTHLTPEQRVVVVMRYFLGKTHAEIGEAVGRREPAVRATLGRALRRLRRVIGDA